eukprot:2515222-Pleurochrysis_carterae.AAC.3
MLPGLAVLFAPGLVGTARLVLLVVVRFAGPRRRAQYAAGYHICTASSKVRSLRLLHSYILSMDYA